MLVQCVQVILRIRLGYHACGFCRVRELARLQCVAMCCSVLRCVAVCWQHLWVVSCERVSEGVRGKAASSFGGNVRGLVREFGVWRIGEEIGWTVGERMGERIGERVCWRESVGCSLRE